MRVLKHIASQVWTTTSLSLQDAFNTDVPSCSVEMRSAQVSEAATSESAAAR